MADDPELTDGDYPSEDTLQRIQAVAFPREALELAERAWHWDGWATRTLWPAERAVVGREDEEGVQFVRFATGGWSGNEDIIGALNKNVMVRAMCWLLSARGGLHIYELPPSVDAVDPSAASTGTPTTRDKAAPSHRVPPPDPTETP